MAKNLSAKYQEYTEILTIKLVDDFKIFLKKQKKKCITKISQKMKKINWLSVEKNIEQEKMPYNL